MLNLQYDFLDFSGELQLSSRILGDGTEVCHHEAVRFYAISPALAVVQLAVQLVVKLQDKRLAASYAHPLSRTEVSTGRRPEKQRIGGNKMIESELCLSCARNF